MDYGSFLASKTQAGGIAGFDPDALPDFLFDFQRELVAWSLRKGRDAIFADCGLGKTPMQLVWAEQVARRTGKPVLVATPLAVGYQALREAGKFGLDAARSQDGTVPTGHHVVVTNYERVHLFRADDFGGMVCDESSILKNFDGVRRAAITDLMRTLPYRLLCTATAAPNDYIELGTSSEALGELGYMDMLSRFFRNENNTADSKSRAYGAQVKWRFKGHAEEPFWRWVCSWARAVRRPSDMGCDDGRFVLPPLEEREHVVKAVTKREGFLFDIPAHGFHEEREERRRTVRERCEKVAELVNHGEQALVWCHLNDEGNLLESLIPGAVQVSGSDDDETKEARLLAFAEGNTRVLVTKPKIGAWGLNLQKCAHVTFFPSHSYEQYYQGVRRCWRFGQARPVRVDIVTTDGSAGAAESLKRKAAQADRMFSALVKHMNDALHIGRATDWKKKEEIPQWLSRNN
ncbi:MAG TPA: helicase-related protein [Planctomycetota bacterium]|nr:helicase-related protein [Planctomycetota bacterium]